MDGGTVIPLAARRRAMHAASMVETSTCREAAIVGGIVRCVISCGRINVPWVSQYAADVIRDFRLAGVASTLPGPTEVLTIVERFQQSYSQPFPG